MKAIKQASPITSTGPKPCQPETQSLRVVELPDRARPRLTGEVLSDEVQALRDRFYAADSLLYLIVKCSAFDEMKTDGVSESDEIPTTVLRGLKIQENHYRLLFEELVRQFDELPQCCTQEHRDLFDKISAVANSLMTVLTLTVQQSINCWREERSDFEIYSGGITDAVQMAFDGLEAGKAALYSALLRIHS